MNKNVTINELISKYSNEEKIKALFKSNVITKIENEEYKENLITLFEYAIDYNPGLFSNKVKLTKIDEKWICEDNSLIKSFDTWCSKYVKEISNPVSQRKLKSTGELDPALTTRIAKVTKKNDKEIKSMAHGHFIFMSAENVNGAILEEYLAGVLKEDGWIWCAGAAYRACDFAKIDGDETVLLQIKNKYNTENSSSSAIRTGTTIKKWQRLNKPNKDAPLDPIPNWDALVQEINPKSGSKYLNEESYLKYIKDHTTVDETFDK